jgi:hypothetical protein
VRSSDHEENLYTAHTPDALELSRASSVLVKLNLEEKKLTIDTREWRNHLRLIAAVEGWIFVAANYGKTRRSFARCIERENLLLKPNPLA